MWDFLDSQFLFLLLSSHNFRQSPFSQSNKSNWKTVNKTTKILLSLAEVAVADILIFLMVRTW